MSPVVTKERIAAIHWVYERFSVEDMDEFRGMVDQREAELLGVTK